MTGAAWGADGTAGAGLHSDRLRSFVAAHGGAGQAVVEAIGRAGVRIVVVGADGAYCDAIAPSVESAREICEKAGVAVAEGWTRELTASVTPGPADRRRMAGTGR
jgi:hypothetical protein